MRCALASARSRLPSSTAYLIAVNLIFVVGILNTGALAFKDSIEAVLSISIWDRSIYYDERRYLGNLVTTCCLLLLFRRFRVQIYQALRKFLESCQQRNQEYTGHVIVSFVLILAAVYITKFHIGFWHAGIGGWNYYQAQSRYSENQVLPPVHSQRIIDGLNRAINHRALRFWPTAGYLRGKALLLEFDKVVLPANYDIFGIVFPEYIFGELYTKVKNPDLFARIIKEKLDKERTGTRNLLPIALSYPNHAPFFQLDYRSYPPSQRINKISAWDFEIALDPAVQPP